MLTLDPELAVNSRHFLECVQEPEPPHPIPGSPDHFTIPSWLQYEDGPFAHQGEAVSAWCNAGYRGVLEMATGSGKTIASLIGAYHLYQEHPPLLIVVAAPFIPLVEQWCDEISKFGLRPVNLTTAGNLQGRGRVLQRLRRRLRTGLSDVEVVVVSHDTLCTPEFLAVLEKFNSAKLLIADEVHNLGRLSFISALPEFFEYRLGLSATPVRQYDQAGTDTLFEFFGPVIFRFTLREAIGHCLVEYDYYAHPVDLTYSEMDEWFYLTGKIKRNAWRLEQDEPPDEYLAKLLRDRRSLLETASGKITSLAALLDKKENGNLRHTLIYASDKEPDQLIGVNQLLQDRNILFHQITAKETTNRNQTRQIIQSFQEGEIQVLTAKRVLDEGVDIPQVCKAFILASTTVQRQWIQRRGRLLRTCKNVEKTHSVIHDLIVLPPNMARGLDPDMRRLVQSELCRVQEFTRLSRNAGRLDGPLTAINLMVNAAFR